MVIRLWMVCLGVLLVQGCATQQGSTADSRFEIDAVATAQAPWKAGETLSSAVCPFDKTGCTRVFLGVTREGYRVLQEFYPDGKHQLTDPYLLKPEAAWEDIGKLDELPNPKKFMYSNLASHVLVRYLSGAKYIEMSSLNQGEIQFKMWDEGGKLLQEKTVRP